MNRDLIIQQRVDLRSILPTFSRRNSENGTQWGLGYQGEIKMWPWHNYSFGVAPQVRETNRGGGGGGADIGETHRWNDTLIQKHAKERATNVRDTGVWDLRENL